MGSVACHRNSSKHFREAASKKTTRLHRYTSVRVKVFENSSMKSSAVRTQAAFSRKKIYICRGQLDGGELLSLNPNQIKGWLELINAKIAIQF